MKNWLIGILGGLGKNNRKKSNKFLLVCIPAGLGFDSMSSGFAMAKKCAVV